MYPVWVQRPARLLSGDALFGKARRRVLATLLGRPDRRFYFREIVRLAGTGTGAVQRELAKLTAAGLLVREPEGRQTYYRANRTAPVFEELRSLIMKIAGVVDLLREALGVLGRRVDVAFVYGSVAEGCDRASSDVDLCVVGDTEFSEVVTAVAAAERTIGREVTPVVYPVSEFKAKVRSGHHFITAVFRRPKLYVVGDERVLEGLAGKPLDRAARDQPGKR